MKLRRNNRNTQEEATRFGARANLQLGAAQLLVGALSGNIGFATEATHQFADSFSLKSKADAMNRKCPPEKSYRLRKLAARIFLVGGLAGFAGGVYHITSDTFESHGPIEVGAATFGAAVNTAIARKSHNAKHLAEGEDFEGIHDHPHDHHQGATVDSALHIMTDMGTGWLYAAALFAENKYPGTANYALVVNGVISGAAGAVTLRRVEKDNNVDTHVH